MAISGQKHIRIGAENNSAESDNLHTAFTKIEDNFNNLFSNSSQYTTFNSGDGIHIAQNSTLGRVTVTNTGVTNLIEGTGVRLSGSNGEVTVSVSGYANGTLVAGVTKVGIISSTLDVVNTPIISEGNIAVNLTEVNSILEGEYIAPTVTVDKYGRITQIANTESAGTVTSVAVTAGPGLAVTGSPITNHGEIVVTNTGVLRLTAGPGIQLTDTTGNITIAATTVPISGTVTRVGAQSSTLVVTQSPITTSGNINIELPDAITLSGDFEADNATFTGNAQVSGNLSVTGSSTLHAVSASAITATGNVTGANLVTAGVLTVTGNASVGNLVTTIANVTTANVTTLSVTGNANAGNIGVSGVVTVTGNITGGNLTSTGTLTIATANAGNVTATGNVTTANLVSNIATANYLIVGRNTLPTGTIPDGTIAVDAANSRIGVRIAGAWKYATLS